MDAFLHDLRFAVRSLRKSPGFAAIAIATLALGIGANTAVFSVVHGVLLRDLPYPQADRLVILRARHPQLSQLSLSVPDFLAWRAGTDAFEQLAGFRSVALNLAGRDGDAERLDGRMVSATLLPALGVRPALGRDFTTEDDRPGAPAVGLLSHELWVRRFGAEPGVVGSTLELDGKPHTIVGILPPDFRFSGEPEVLVPLGPWMAEHAGDRGSHPGLWGLGRLRPGITAQQAVAQLAGIAKSLAETYPDTNEGVEPVVVRLHEDAVGASRPALLALFGAVGFVLLIACVNVAGLLVARAAGRRREMAIRTSLGASRGRLIRQLLVESLTLSIASGVAGVVLAVWGLDVLLSMAPASLPRQAEIGIDLWALGFAAGASTLCGLLFGMAPAFLSSRTQPSGSLRASDLRGGSAGLPGLEAVLVVGEVALALMLLVGAGLLIRSLHEVEQVDPGFDVTGSLTARVSLSAAGYAEASQVFGFYERTLQELRAMPGVRQAAVASGLPLRGASENWVWPADRPLPRPGEFELSVLYAVSPGYLEVMDIPLTRGRFFTARDQAASLPVCVIDEDLARRFFPDADPLGRRLLIDPEGQALEIVGVVGSVRHYGLDWDPLVAHEIYLPYQQIPEAFAAGFLRTMEIVVSGDEDPARLTASLRTAIRAVDADQPLYDVEPLRSILNRETAFREFQSLIFGAFAAFALALAGLGLYGTLVHAVSRRTREIGVRMALGATTGGVIGLFVLKGVRLTLLGIVMGTLGSLLLGRLLQGLLFGISASDPWTLATVPFVLLMVGLAACWLPARQAARVNPLLALQAD